MQTEYQSSTSKVHEMQRLNELKPIARLSPYDIPRRVRARHTDSVGDTFNLHESSKAISVEGVQSLEEMKVLRAIVAREQGLDRLLECCCSFEKDRTVELLETMLQVRMLSLDTIDAIAGWRRRMIKIQPFLWRKVNYVLKMACDLDFLSRSHQCIVAMDGIRLIKRNPLTTIGGLDQNMTMLWQYELPEEGDLSVLLDSASFVSSGVTMDVASRIRLAEWFIVLEERRYGKLSMAQIDSVDHRSKELIKREADFASKARFGLAQRDDE